MVTFSESEFRAHQLKHAPKQVAPTVGVSREVEELHLPILEWARTQCPIVPVIRARSDLPSTIAEGAHDITLFYRGRAICIECKAKGKKLRTPQLAWKMLMELQGITVHTVYTMEQFHQLIENNKEPK